MTVPGSNILARASRLIAQQTLIYLAYAGRTTMPNGMLVPNYAPPITVQGSIQPVPRTIMELLGLDMQRRYVNIFVSQTVIDIQRDTSSDKFNFGGTTYQIVSITPWAMIDGWVQALSVEVPPC